MAGADDDPGLPVKLHPVSNGEFLAPPPTPLAREAARRSRRALEEGARRSGMSRRRFLLSSMGTATMLGVLAACADDQRGTPTGGTFVVPPEAANDPEAEAEALGPGEGQIVFDVQGHFLAYNHDVPGGPPGFPQSACGEEDPRDCYSVDRFLDLIFNQSDTSMVVLSAVPFGGDLLTPAVMAEAVALAERLCDEPRVLMQGEASPSRGELAVALDNLARLRQDLPVAAWKTYTHAGGPGWYLDDHDPAAPQVGEAFLAAVAELGPPIVAVHKGFGSGSPFASPIDVGPAAAAHPELSFVVYHSGFDGLEHEGPYDPTNDQGVDRLITSLREAGVGPGANVYAELGSTWFSIMRDPDVAGHVLGKLLVALGPDNVVWGTDSIWYGSPQDQIQAFRAFQITEEAQERFGYPAITDELRAKVLGGTSLALYGVEGIPGRCTIDPAAIEDARQASSVGNATFGPRTPRQLATVQRAHAVEHGWV